MEVINSKQDYFACKIYKIIKNGENNEGDVIDLEEIYRHKLYQQDTLTSIQQVYMPNLKTNDKNINILDNVVFVVSSNNSNLEVVNCDEYF